MNLRSLLSLEIWLPILLIAHMNSSIVNSIGHTPSWSALFAAGFLGALLYLRPRATGLVLLAALLTALVAGAAFGPIGDGVIVFTSRLAAELAAWQGAYDHPPGPFMTLYFSMLSVFILVYLQLKTAHRGGVYLFLILLGLILYTVLWLLRYPNAETDLLLYFALAFSTCALFFLRKQGDTSRRWYKIGVISLGAVCTFAAGIMPLDLEPLKLNSGTGFTGTLLDGAAPERGGKIRGVQGAAKKKTGYSPGGELGGSLTVSRTPVMSIELKEGSFPPVLYLRGRASDYYTGRSWEARNAEPVEGLEVAFADVMMADNAEITLLVEYLHAEQDLFGLFPTTGIELYENEKTVETGMPYRVDSLGNLKAARDDFAGSYLLAGKVITEADFNRWEPRDTPFHTSEALAPFLQLPDGLPERVEALSHQIVANADTDLEKVIETKEYLRQFPYSLDTPYVPPGEDFVDFFIFELQEGYCAYYASAMVVLLRIQNIPARYVAGYRAPAIPEEELPFFTVPWHLPEMRDPRSMVVRSSHAHAWVEVFLQGYGWVAFEPTRPFGISNDFPGHESDEIGSGHHVEPASPDDKDAPAKLIYGGVLLMAGLFFTGGWLLVRYELSHAKSPVDLYAKVIKIKSIFHKPPGPGETPGGIIDQIKKEFPDISVDLELMKYQYQICRYARRTEGTGAFQAELESLPLKSAQLYRRRCGLIKYPLGWFKLFPELLLKNIAGSGSLCRRWQKVTKT